MYYIKTKDWTYSASEVRGFIGVDPDVFVNLDMLNRLGVYPVITPVELTTATKLFYDVTTSYVINGNYAERTFTPTLKSIDEVKVVADRLLFQKFLDDAAASGVDGVDELNTQLQTNLTSVDAATSSNDVVSVVEFLVPDES